MKKYLEYLLLLSPILLWWLSSALLGPHFTLPNRLILAALCTATGAAGLLMQRKGPGLLALIAGVAMLATVPISHDMPRAAFNLRMQGYDLHQASALDLDLSQAQLAAHPADLVSLKGNPAQTASLMDLQKLYPHTYESCASNGRSFLSRYPISKIEEQYRLGALQVKGQLQAGDTIIGFAVLDFTALQNEAEARSLCATYLQGAQAAHLVLVDTGNSGNRIPMEWITYATGFSRSRRPWTAFTGSFEAPDEDSSQALLYGPSLLCKSFDINAVSMEGNFVITDDETANHPIL